MKYTNLLEEEIKIKVRDDFFADFDSKIIGKIDFCITSKNKNPNQKRIFEDEISLLWGEAKTGDYDVVSMFTQLILTIGKTKDFKNQLPPAFLTVFDSKKIVFVSYNSVMDIFTMNDFNWNVTSSNHKSIDFLLIKERIESTLEKNKYVYDFLKDEKELKFFIKNNIAKATESGKILITKNNFVPIYLRWIEQVKPSIDFDWEAGKKQNIFDSNFFLADLFVDDNNTIEIEDDVPISENLFVVFKNENYEIAKENLKSLFDAKIKIKNKNLYTQFWKKYKRPPVEEIRQHIINRKDLLVAQDIRERKGAFFTPRIWVELSQEYLAETLGEDWQQNHYVWDCAAGTGNLLVGLTETRNLFASTLDQSDVNVMHELINKKELNLFENHVFQFDFLNDEFIPVSKGGKLPDVLYKIISNENERKKLVIYINPPYAEATNAKTVTGTGENKSGVTTNFKINEYYKPKIGNASNEIFALFMAIIYEKLPDSILAQFSKLKFVNGSNFKKFKNYFLANFLGGFIVPAETFDNVKGKFPIGFTIWNTFNKQKIETISTSIYNKNGEHQGNKNFFGNLPESINKWIKIFDDKEELGLLVSTAPDFQHNNQLVILSKKQERYCFNISKKNLIPFLVYFSVRHCIEATWLNDRDQFLHPNNGWEKDVEFQNDCLTYALFHGQNRISSKEGINHFIPFTEKEIEAKGRFDSNFMTEFINNKVDVELKDKDLFSDETNEGKAIKNTKREFSNEAQQVFNSGRELWKYYHSQTNTSINASLYDIKEHFQGRNEKGRMNASSNDETYTKLLTSLKENLKILAKKIEPKVYKYGFLKE